MRAVSLRLFALLFMSTIGTWAQQQAPIMAVNAPIGSPAAVTTDASGSVYFSSSFNRVFKVDHGGVLTVVAGTGAGGFSGDGGPAANAELNNPQGVVFDSAGNLYISDSGNSRVRKVSPAGIITTVAGNGTQGYWGDSNPATDAELNAPSGLAIDGAGDLYILDVVQQVSYSYGVVRQVSLAKGIITTVAGCDLALCKSGFIYSGLPGTEIELDYAGGVAVDQAGTLYVGVESGIKEFSPAGAYVTEFGFYGVPWVAVDRAGHLYADDGGEIYAVSPTGALTLVAGNGNWGYAGDGSPAVQAEFYSDGMAFDTAGNLYIADSGNRRIREVSSATGIITTIAGNGGNPVLSSVVNGASFQAGIVSNSWFTILGTDLSSTTDTWANAIVTGILPTSLDGVSVYVHNQPAYIYYVSPTQINAIAPNIDCCASSSNDLSFRTFGVTVSGPNGTSSVFLVSEQLYWPDGSSINPYSDNETLQPAFFLWPGGYAVATRQNFSWAVKDGTFPGTTTVPAKPGDVIILWGTGFGPTRPATPEGVLIPTGTIYNTANSVAVSVGGVAAKVYGAALSPGYAGLYQVAIQIPPSLIDGDYSVIATINGVNPVSASPASTLITVQQ